MRDSRLVDKSRRGPRPRSNAVTAQDVARVAGVSIATVSRVLNGNIRVAPALRERVSAVANRLGYTPHAAAKALASQRSMTIGAVVPTLENANFAAGIAALQEYVNEAGYTLLLASSNYDHAEELAQVRTLASHGVAGVVLVGSRRNVAVYEELVSKKTPYVTTWVLDDMHPSVGFDNEAMGRTVAEYLTGLGHRKFALITQLRANDRSSRRIAGLLSVLAERGISIPPERYLERPLEIREGQLAMNYLWALPDPPTAVIASDVLAFGALAEAVNMRIDVPDQLSVLGIQDIEFAAHLHPPLTAIQLPAREIGRKAAEVLLAAIKGRAPAAPTTVAYRLIERGSTGPPRVSSR